MHDMIENQFKLKANVYLDFIESIVLIHFECYSYT